MVRLGGVSVVFGLFATLACSSPRPREVSFALPADDPSGEPISERVLLIAGNQAHFWQSELGGWNESAGARRPRLRSPELDVFGQDLLGWIVEHAEDGKLPIFHLGDALSLSCVTEMNRFAAVMARSRRAWFLSPGNHDGYFQGSGGPRSRWRLACRNGGGALDRAAFIQSYLELLSTQPDPAARAFGREATPRSETGRWASSPSQPGLLRRVEWHIRRGGAVSRSYLLQEVELSLADALHARPVRAILVDTAQYELEPSGGPRRAPGQADAALAGSMLSDQLDTLESWLAAAERDGALVVLFGHHSEQALIAPARDRMRALRERYRVPLYVSAHAQASAYYVHDGGSEPAFELGIGSTLAWPAQYRSFQLNQVHEADAVRRTYVRSPRFELWRVWQARSGSEPGRYPDCVSKRGAWYGALASVNRYPVPDQPELAAARRPIQKALLEVFARLIQAVPTLRARVWPSGTADDAAVSAKILAAMAPSASIEQQAVLLRELEVFEDTRQALDAPLHRRYRLCQALWASSASAYGYEPAGEDPSFLVFPPAEPAPR